MILCAKYKNVHQNKLNYVFAGFQTGCCGYTHDVNIIMTLCAKYNNVHYNKLNYVFAGFQTLIFAVRYNNFKW